MTNRAFIFAGGGTGGHLYPGLAIAGKLAEGAQGGGQKPRVLFVCSQRPLDAEILEKERVQYRTISAVPMIMRPKGLLRFGMTWSRAVGESRAIIRAVAAEMGGVEPIVVAMGGFVAAPVVRAAQKEGCKVVLVNLDAEPGKANRLIARVAKDGIYSAAIVDSAARGGTRAQTWQVVGPIVRDAALAKGTRAECCARLGLDPARPVLMVTGGSQGAQSINDFVTWFFEADSSPQVRAWQVLHQTGKVSGGGGGGGGGVARFIERYQTLGVPAVVREFVDGMGTWWGAADLAVCRAGAGSVAEAWANRVPTVFMPYPYHKDEHQRKNAAGLARAGAASLVKDEIGVEQNLAGSAGAELASLLSEPGRRQAMKKALDALGPADGAGRVAEALWTLSTV